MTPPRTIKRIATLEATLKQLQEQATTIARNAGTRARTSLRINKQTVTCQVTPKTSNGEHYVLFYRDDQRTSRSRLAEELGIPVDAE